jgi:hypothetical protein
MPPTRLRLLSCHRRVRFPVALALLITLLPALAQPTGSERERGSIVLGAFITDRSTATRLDSNLRPGTEIELEKDLGLESSTTVFRLGGDVWIGAHHRLDFGLFDLSRSATRRIDETIEFGDETFGVDTTVTTESDLTIVKADYTFAFLDRPRGYLGVTGGLYIGQIKLGLSTPGVGQAETEDLTAPLPVAGFRGEYRFTDRMALRGAAQWFSIDVGDASGSLRDLYLGADYSIGRRYAVGLAYNEVTMNINANETGGFVGHLDWGYDGWMLYFKTDFAR